MGHSHPKSSASKTGSKAFDTSAARRRSCPRRFIKRLQASASRSVRFCSEESRVHGKETQVKRGFLAMMFSANALVPRWVSKSYPERWLMRSQLNPFFSTPSRSKSGCASHLHQVQLGFRGLERIGHRAKDTCRQRCGFRQFLCQGWQNLFGKTILHGQNVLRGLRCRG